jgi:GT2 family glycosyltransferase
VDYSIVIPVFNKAAFTKRCLDTLQATLTGAGEGEVIVVDNASSDETPELLTKYPWIRLIRNERNLGFAGANNQAARVARGDYLVLLNNDTEAFPGWLAAMLRAAREPGVGAVGAKLLFPNRTVQHAGVVITGALLGRNSLAPFHHNYLVTGDDADVCRRADFQIVTGACLATPRALYEKLGGLDEQYWNGYEDVDYCLKVRERGLRVVYEPAAALFHFESQSGVQRFRKALYNVELLEQRWRGKVTYDSVIRTFARGHTRRFVRTPNGGSDWLVVVIPRVTAIVHGEPSSGRSEFEAMLRRGRVQPSRVVWADRGAAAIAAREAMEVRGNHAVVFVDAQARLEPEWLDELLAQVEGHPTVCAATGVPELPIGENVATLAADARCTLVKLYAVPQHLRLKDFETIDAAVADFLLRATELDLGTRGARRPIAAVREPLDDPSFERVHGMRVRDVLATDPALVEARLRAVPRRARGLVSIVTLSWNAPQFTRMAVDSILRYTSEPYELIVVDNGSREETLEYLRGIADPHVRVIYNGTNLGYGGGNNVGMAEARGQYVVLLNNDVIVTKGWLDALLGPFDRMPRVGVSAPRSNKVVGPQQVADAQYDDEAGIHAYAKQRRERFAEQGFLTERAIGLCLCIDRRVIDEIGGFDERFEVGNFEDDDLSVRVRGAGYEIYVCDDAYIHHFGSQSFAANNVDYRATITSNWKRFAEKWGYGPDVDPTKGYDPRRASLNGFVRALHYAPLPEPPQARPIEPAPAPTKSGVVFAASVRSEQDWSDAVDFLRRYVRAFTAEDAVRLTIAAFGDPDAQTIGKRVMRLLEREGIPERAAPDVEISDEEDETVWRASLEGVRVHDVASIEERSPSALRRFPEIAAPAV